MVAHRITSKIIPPLLRSQFIRVRLIHSLQQNQDKKLVLILGQAAQGKSTLAASYVNTLNTPFAWVNLDPEDSDPATLLHFLAESIKHALKKPLRFSFEFPPAPSRPADEIFIYRNWVQSLFAPAAVPLLLVMDGLDRLRPNAASFRFLQVLVREAPADVRLLMLSREMPPLDVMSLKILKEVYILDNGDLAYTLDETDQFLRRGCGLTITADGIRKINRLTEGWVGGLVLLAESLSSFGAPAGETAVLDALPGHFSREVFEYFGEAIFGAQPADTRDFLIRSSVVETLEPELAKELTGINEAHAVLRDLARRNLFVQVAYDQRRGWLYRYHPLFRSFLQDKFKAEIDAETGRELWEKAGSLHERTGEWEEAVKCLLRAKAYDRAVSVIQTIGMDLIKQGRNSVLAKWIEKLPQDLVQANPWMLYFHFMTGRWANFGDVSSSLIRAFELFQEYQDVSGQILSLAYLIKVRNASGNLFIPVVPSLLVLAENLLQSSPRDKYLYERAVLWLQISSGYYVRRGDLLKAQLACQNAYQLAEYIGDTRLALNALIHSHAALSLMGELSKAARLARKIENLLGKHAYAEMRVLHLLNLVQFATFEGDAQNGVELQERANQEIAHHGLSHLKPLAMLYELWLKNRLGEYEETLDLTSNFAVLTSGIGNQFLIGNAFLHTGLVQYQRANYQKAKESLEKAKEVFSSGEGASNLHFDVAETVLRMTFRHTQQGLGSLKELERALARFEQGGAHMFLPDCHLAIALIRRQLSETEDVARHLGAGFSIMEKRGFKQLLFLNREDFLEACILAMEMQVDGAKDCAAHLLSTKLADVADGELKRLSDHPDAKVAKSAREIRVTIHRAAVPKLRIETLGHFQVYCGDVLIAGREWVAKQPKLLLQAIVAHGSRAVPKEFLLEALWPEPATDSGEKNFKVILHRLRRFLEPDMREDFGSSYVHLKANLVSLDEELCQVDADHFLRLIKEGELKERSGDIKGAISVYGEAERWYQGDFLPEEPYSLWAYAKREELRMKHYKLLTSLAALYEKRGSLRKAIGYYKQLIEIDPLHEEPYQKLMALYANSRMVNAALKVYEKCKRTFREQLDLEPDEIISSMHRRLLESHSRR